MMGEGLKLFGGLLDEFQELVLVDLIPSLGLP